MTYEEFIRKYQFTLNPQQAQAVQNGDGPILILSVPGSGKTTVTLARIGYLLFCKEVNQKQILALTFNNLASKELQTRFKSKYSILPLKGIGQTIHSFCTMIHSRHISQPNFIDQGEVDGIIRRKWKQIHGTSPSAGEESSVRSIATYKKTAW